MIDKIVDYRIHEIREAERLLSYISVEEFVEFLRQNTEPLQHEHPGLQRGLENAFSREPNKGGFVLIAECYGMLLGALVMLRTGMAGDVPENLLLHLSVHDGARNVGVGGALIHHALEICKGDVKLHVEYSNPIKRFYERFGFRFTSKYGEMRYHHEST